MDPAGEGGEGGSKQWREGPGNVLTNNYHIHEKFSNGSVNSPYDIFTIHHVFKWVIRKKQLGL